MLLLGRWAGQQNCSAQESAFKITQDGAPLHKELNPVKFSGFVGGGGHHIPPGSLPHTDQPLCLPRLESLFPQSCRKLCNPNPRWPSMSDSLGIPQSLCWILRLGS